MTSTAVRLKQITVNGKAQPVLAATVAELVAQLELDSRKVAIERNLAIVPRSAYDATPISDGDRIEIVGFIGGG